MFTHRGIHPSVARRSVEEAGSDDTSIHPTASRPAEIVLVAQLVQLRVNGRREHGNVIRKNHKKQWGIIREANKRSHR